METKKQMRARMRELREALGKDARAAADAAIAAQVRAHPAYAQAKAVFTYLSVGSEVDTRAIILDAWAAGKLVVVPRVVPGTRTMEWYAIDGFEGLLTTKMGVEEPIPDPARLVMPPGGESAVSGAVVPDSESSAAHQAGEGVAAVALVPGFTFDAQGYRLGYGGGFYDVFLPAFGGVSLGLCRKAQFSEAPLPHDAYDVPVDEVIVG